MVDIILNEITRNLNMSMTKTMNFFVTFKCLSQDHEDIVIPQYLDGDHNI